MGTRSLKRRLILRLLCASLVGIVALAAVAPRSEQRVALIEFQAAAEPRHYDEPLSAYENPLIRAVDVIITGSANMSLPVGRGMNIHMQDTMVRHNQENVRRFLIARQFSVSGLTALHLDAAAD